mgnify:CR=1 FL=1
MNKHYEYLTKLYLRLKGYVVSNLIIHSNEQGNSASEIDVIGVRMPFHLQEDRQVEVVDNLECSPDRIEILIADVKNTKNLDLVKFNKGLRNREDSIKKLIGWLGCYDIIEDELVKKFSAHLNLHADNQINGFSQFQDNLKVGFFNFKFTFFCPSLDLWNGKGFKYINGTQMIDFIWECLNEERIIETCSRRYNFEGWNEFENYIKFFKESKVKVSLNDFEKEFAHIKPLRST